MHILGLKWVAKDEVLQQQQPSPSPKNRKLSHERQGNGEGINNKNSTPASHKGHFAFTGYTPVRGTLGASDYEGDGPTYSQICQPVHDNLLKTDVECHQFVTHGIESSKPVIACPCKCRGGAGFSTFNIWSWQVKLRGYPCDNQKLKTCQPYSMEECLRQHQLYTTIPRHHKHYILPKSVNKKGQFSPQLQADDIQKNTAARSGAEEVVSSKSSSAQAQLHAGGRIQLIAPCGHMVSNGSGLGTESIRLSAETLGGLHPIKTVSN